MEAAPLILTLNLDKHSFLYFDDLRQKHFPPERDFLKAHLTLFHHLPANETSIQHTIKDVCLQQAHIPLQITGVVCIGKGVAYKIESTPLLTMHRQLQNKWMPWLTPQDKQKLWPYVTVQNKVAPATAQKLHNTLQQSFAPFTAYGTGFSLWAYLGGPWQLQEVFHLVQA